MAVGDIYKVAVEGELHLQQVINTFFYIEQATGAGNGAAVLAAEWLSTVEPAYLDILSVEYTMVSVTATKIKPGEPPIQVFSANNGTVAGQCLPTTVSTVLSRRSDLPGRSRRGRIYVPAVPVSFEDNSSVSGPGITAYEAFLAVMNGNLVPGAWDFDPAIYSKLLNTAVPTTRWTLNRQLRVQRRREVGVGR